MDMNKTIEHLHAVIEDRYPLGWNTKNDKIRVSATKLLDLIDEAYVHVEWPETQEFMEEDWFEEEAVLDVDSPIGSCYFIPLARVFNLC
jgi:hypothetical protein